MATSVSSDKDYWLIYTCICIDRRWNLVDIESSRWDNWVGTTFQVLSPSKTRANGKSHRPGFPLKCCRIKISLISFSPTLSISKTHKYLLLVSCNRLIHSSRHRYPVQFVVNFLGHSQTPKTKLMVLTFNCRATHFPISESLYNLCWDSFIRSRPHMN